VELTQLRYFVTIAETLSFTEAAGLVHVSQPALSYQMRRLEEELGTRLFDRKSRKIALTPDGELLLPLAQAVLARADEAVRLLRDHSGVEAGEVHMGGNPSVVTYLVPALIASFHQVFPRVRIEVVEGGDLDLQHRVYSGALDFAIVTAPGAPQTLDVTPLGKEDLLVAVPPAHRLAGRTSIELSELAFEDFVLPVTAYNLTQQLIDACRRAGFEPRAAYRASSLESVKNFVREGLGVSVLPNIALNGPGREGLAVIQVQGGLTRELNLIRGKDRSVSRAAHVLMTHMRSSIVKHMKYPAASQVPPRSTAGLETAASSERRAGADD
jgi:DNA-binding transcriptional LysR family regulator